MSACNACRCAFSGITLLSTKNLVRPELDADAKQIMQPICQIELIGFFLFKIHMFINEKTPQ